MHDINEQILQHEYLIWRVIYKYGLAYDKDNYLQIGRVAIWQAAQDFDASKGIFEMYAYMRIKFAIIRVLNKNIRVLEHEVTVEDELIFDTNELSPQQPQDRPEWYDELALYEQRMIERLYYEGYSMKELAVMEGISYEAMKKRRQRLLVKIQELLEARSPC